MIGGWLWDRKITDAKARRILKKPDSISFLTIAALLLSRNNEPRKVFKSYLDPVIFCRYWPTIKRKMRQDRWSEPRIVFWQAIYEKLSDRYRRKGMVFRQEAPAREPFCEVIGKRMADIRREQDLSQIDLAKKIGISQQLISRIEKGRENVSLMTLRNIMSALNKKVNIDFEDR